MNSNLENQFKALVGSEADALVSAPGRVNLIGEHTDYNDGFVLPVAINYQTDVAVGRRDDRVIRAFALDELDENGEITCSEFSLDETIQRDDKAPWSNYLRGVVKNLLNENFALCGADLVIQGNVPRGAGLSSSASLENALVRSLTEISNLEVDGVKSAKIGQAAENNFVGCQCGIMDQMVSAMGQAGKAMLLDCRSLDFSSVAMPENSSLIVINSNVKRGLVDSEYNTRREQCEAVAKHFKVNALRDLTLATLESHETELDPLAFKRAHHVVTENMRTVAAGEALSEGNLEAMGRLMYESHESMKNDFEITVPQIDYLVDIIREVIGDQGGVRMTGGGFGGCVVALVPGSLENPVIEKVQKHYQEKTGLSPDIFICSAVNGAFVQ